MANQVLWDASPSETSYLTTGLNALADGANVLGGAIDNDAGLSTFMALEIYLAEQASARDADARVEVYLLPSVDGTNYCYGDTSPDPPKGTLVAVCAFDAAVTARYSTAVGIPVPPFKFKLLVMNETGQAFAATGNTVKYGLYNYELQ